MRIAKRSADPFLRLLTATATAWVIGQVFINVGYVIGLLPVTGIQLPLISAGGTSTATTLFMVGFDGHVARHEPDAVAALRAGRDDRMNRLLRLPMPEPYVPTRVEALADRLRSDRGAAKPAKPAKSAKPAKPAKSAKPARPQRTRSGQAGARVPATRRPGWISGPGSGAAHRPKRGQRGRARSAQGIMEAPRHRGVRRAGPRGTGAASHVGPEDWKVSVTGESVWSGGVGRVGRRRHCRACRARTGRG